MNTQDEIRKSKVVLKSLESFDSLRVGLAYLRSVSIILERDEDFSTNPVPVWIADVIKYRGKNAVLDVEQLESQMQSYYLATTSLPVALLYAALCHYKELANQNSRLRYAKLDSVLEEMEENGLFEKMREFRNAIFHVRPNKRIDQQAQDIFSFGIESNLKFARLEQLLYDFTEHVFRNFEILLQESREKLEDGYKKALAHYDTLPHSVREEHEKELKERGGALDNYS